MSNHNYSQYSKKNNNNNPKTYNKPKTEERTTVVEAPEEPLEIKMVTTACTGVVVNCSKLNIRVKPSTDSDVLTALNVGSEVMIDNTRSTTEWLKITTAAGIDGFCMRRFVSVIA